MILFTMHQWIWIFTMQNYLCFVVDVYCEGKRKFVYICFMILARLIYNSERNRALLWYWKKKKKERIIGFEVNFIIVFWPVCFHYTAVSLVVQWEQKRHYMQKTWDYCLPTDTKLLLKTTICTQLSRRVMYVHYRFGELKKMNLVLNLFLLLRINTITITITIIFFFFLFLLVAQKCALINLANTKIDELKIRT